MGKLTVMVEAFETLFIILIAAGLIKDAKSDIECNNNTKRSAIATIVICSIWIAWRLWITYLTHVAFWR